MLRNLNFPVFPLGFALSVLLSIGAAAQAPAASDGGAPGVKIGVINIQEAILTTNEGKKEVDGLQTRFAPKQAELKTLNDELDNLKKQLQAQGDKLSEEERGNRARAIDAKQKTFTRNLEDAQNEFQQAEQDLVNRIGQKMVGIMEKYAREHGYAVILDVSGQQTPVLWANQANSVTKELVDAYNAAAPTAPAPKPAASSAAPARPAGAASATPKKP